MVAVAEQQFHSFSQVKIEILEKLELAKQHIDALHDVVLGSVRSEETPAGVLIQESAEYLACLDLQHARFEQLLQDDEKHWSENLDLKRERAFEITNSLELLYQKQQKEIEALMCESFSVKNLAGIDRFQGSFIESSIQSEEE